MFQLSDFKKKDKSPVSLSSGRLTIDCTHCPGPSSVDDRQCLICMCDAVKDSSEFDSMVLHSSVDTSFQGAPLELIRELAGVYSVLTMDASERRGGRCRTCRNSYGRLVADQIPAFPDIDIGMLRARAAQCRVQTEACAECLRNSVSLFGHMENMIAGIRSSVSQKEGE